MATKCKYSKMVPIKELKNHPKNPNVHSQDQVARLAQIIEYQGFRSPIIVSNLSGLIVAGHGRLAAAQKLGLKTVPVDYQDFDSEAQEYAHIVADNAIAEWAELDLSQINTEALDLGDDFDIDLLGMKDFIIEVADKYDEETEDEVPEEQSDPDTVVGDIWKLGRHRLMCGDATNEYSVESLLSGETIDMLFTDPPYGMDYSGRGEKTSNKILNDTGDVSKLYNLFQQIPERYIWGRVENYADLELKPRDIIIWKKNVFGMGRGYRGQYECCFYYGGFAGSDSDVWEVARDRKYEHPTQKPVDLAERAIKNSKPKTVLDAFGGSGSTLIACEKTNRTCYMMELEPKYVRVIIDRWEKYTGQKAELTNG